MNQVPHITEAQFKAMFPLSSTMFHVANNLIDKANAEQHLISAEEARKLGAGKAEVLSEYGIWLTVNEDCPYRETWKGAVVKYRAIKQPEPVEPTFTGLKKVSTESLPPEFEKILHENLWELYESDKPVQQWPSPHVNGKPVEPTCQVRNDDTGVTETMTRCDVINLLKELGVING